MFLSVTKTASILPVMGLLTSNGVLVMMGAVGISSLVSSVCSWGLILSVFLDWSCDFSDVFIFSVLFVFCLALVVLSAGLLASSAMALSSLLLLSRLSSDLLSGLSAKVTVS
ncbi:hypothetical protein [Moraxella lacunata]|uniref:hypothetical protein n=1 Tax=Moraxella lacunata TaxID=477 RepID=UPI003EE408A0